MTEFQKIVKYIAIALAVFLAFSIIGGIISTVGLFFGIAKNDGVTDDITAYTVSSDVDSLDIDIGAADFTVAKADSFSLESNLENLTVKEDNGTLIIKEKSRFGTTYNGAVITLHVPEGTSFDNVRIETGAGRFRADVLSADRLKLELGAGDVSIGELNAAVSADIDGGAGRITVDGGALNSLELDMGVGQLNMTSTLGKSSELDLGIGETNLTLIGSKNDYRIDVEKGIGSVTVDGEKPDSSTVGNGSNRVEINGGVGSINISFSDK